MKKRIVFAAIVVAVLLVVLTTVEMVQSGQWHGSAMLVVVVVPLLAIQFYAVARQKPVKGPEEIDDDDGSIDWREENVDGEIVDVWNGWAVLLHDVPVHEAKAVAEKLEESHIRCRLELLREDRAFHHFGNGARACACSSHQATMTRRKSCCRKRRGRNEYADDDAFSRD